MLIRVAHRVSGTLAEGPGTRTALFVQGCSIRCAGCCNPLLFGRDGGEVLEVGALLSEVDAVRGAIEGVTLLGGEPFEQAAALASFAQGVRAMGLGVMTFTGFTLEELRTSGDPGAASLLLATDLLVDGRYDASRPETRRRWCGSTNQRFHHLSERYPRGLERVEGGAVERTIEVRIGADASLALNGWPELSPSAFANARPSAAPPRRTRASSSAS